MSDSIRRAKNTEPRWEYGEHDVNWTHFILETQRPHWLIETPKKLNWKTNEWVAYYIILFLIRIVIYLPPQRS